ncbi:MAG: vitamin B12 dependent-methionine synthase activation domain-containing protein [Candidatus Caldatribacteriota bacterium]|nr:vitamin B12 dependent-methionine synthase activation domain-containing protein [Candidatus Caldatribacteriota bacterium]
MKIIKNIKLKINEEEVLRYQGYSKNKVENPSEVILQITREEIARGHNLFEPQGIYSSTKIKQISFSDGRVDLENGFSLNFSNSIINLLKGTSCLVLGVVTIGSSLENKVSKFFTQGEYPRAIALDAVGTVAVESLSRGIRNLVCQEAKEQYFKITRYFSPGYGDWDINQQKDIFKIIPTNKIGVSLTESCMILPRKSLSWIIGIGKGVVISSKERDACKICKAKNCQYRKTF